MYTFTTMAYALSVFLLIACVLANRGQHITQMRTKDLPSIVHTI
jgi:hypothetical protein